jgi:hypothetical protein
MRRKNRVYPVVLIMLSASGRGLAEWFLLADAERVKDEVQKQAKDFVWQRVNGRLTFGSTSFRKVHQRVESYESG